MVKIVQFRPFGLRPGVMVKWSKIFDHDHGQNFKNYDFGHYLKFWSWSWSKIFDHLTMTPGRRPNGQKVMVILHPPLITHLKTSVGKVCPGFQIT